TCALPIYVLRIAAPVGIGPLNRDLALDDVAVEEVPEFLGEVGANSEGDVVEVDQQRRIGRLRGRHGHSPAAPVGRKRVHDDPVVRAVPGLDAPATQRSHGAITLGGAEDRDGAFGRRAPMARSRADTKISGEWQAVEGRRPAEVCEAAQDGRWTQPIRSSAPASGSSRSKPNAVPLPCTVETVSWDPIASTSLRQIDSPSPEPLKA